MIAKKGERMRSLFSATFSWTSPLSDRKFSCHRDRVCMKISGACICIIEENGRSLYSTVFLILNRSLSAGAIEVASSMQRQLTYRSFLDFKGAFDWEIRI